MIRIFTQQIHWICGEDRQEMATDGGDGRAVRFDITWSSLKWCTGVCEESRWNHLKDKEDGCMHHHPNHDMLESEMDVINNHSWIAGRWHAYSHIYIIPEILFFWSVIWSIFSEPTQSWLRHNWTWCTSKSGYGYLMLVITWYTNKSYTDIQWDFYYQ